MGLWQSRNTFPRHAPPRLHTAGVNIRLCGQAIAREGPAELSSACKKLRKSGSFFKEASNALKEGNQEEAKRGVNFATYFLRVAGEEFERNGLPEFGENLSSCAFTIYLYLKDERRGLNMIKVGFIFASNALDSAVRDLSDPHYAVAKRRLRKAATAIKEIGDLEEVEKMMELTTRLAQLTTN